MIDDPFSEILRLIEPRSVVSGGFSAGGSWAIRFPPPGEIKFSAIAKGTCWFRLDGQEPIRLEEGDVGLLPGRQGFVVASSPTAKPRDWREVFGEVGAFPTIGDGSGCVVLAGGVALEPSSAALLTDVLPPLIHVRATSPRAASLRWIVQELFAERTSALPGRSVASGQLAQLLFVQVLRAHLASSSIGIAGWPRAMQDPQLAPVLRAMHAEPGRSWKLTELAKLAGMSRTSFAVHFRAVAGVAPLGYLAGWRMRLAQRALREGSASVSALASSLGYASESAFSSAFKRITGSAPRTYRLSSATLPWPAQPHA